MILFIIISALTSEEFRLRQAYRKHNSYVQSRVPAEDLLVWKVKDGWEPLCKFLNCPIPEGPIPHDNRTGDTKFIEGLVRMHNLSKLIIHASHLFDAYPYNQLKNMHGNLNLWKRQARICNGIYYWTFWNVELLGMVSGRFTKQMDLGYERK